MKGVVCSLQRMGNLSVAMLLSERCHSERVRLIPPLFGLAAAVVCALLGCSAVADGSHRASPSPEASHTSPTASCDHFYEAKAYAACKDGDLAGAKRLEADYEAGAGSYSPPPSKQFGVGDTVASGGATLTLLSFGQVPSVAVNNTYYQQGSGYESYIDQAPASGSSYYQLTATVKNDGTENMDLTCSLGVDIRLLSSKNEKYDPIDDLYKIKGNPECNHFMQPGYSENMTWVYQVPQDRHIVGAFFTQPFDQTQAPGVFTFDKAYTLTQQ